MDTEEIVDKVDIGPVGFDTFNKVFKTEYDLILHSVDDEINSLRSLYTGEILLTLHQYKDPWSSPSKQQRPFIIKGVEYDIVVFFCFWRLFGRNNILRSTRTR